MGVESPGFANQSGSYSAEVARRAWFGWLARTGANTPGIVTGGLVSASDAQLSAPVSGMTVNVSTGEMYIGGTEGATQGAYNARVSSTTNLVISAANPSNPRIDLVCATVSDSAYTEPTGGSGNQWALQVITGSPTSGATLSNLNGVGTLPASSLLLGYVLVPTSASNIITADISNVAVAARAGLLFTRQLGYRQITTTATANAGDLIYAIGPGAYTLTLPSSPPLDSIVGVVANAGFTGAGPLTVSAGANTIYGVGASGGVSSVALGMPLASVVLQWIGGGTWIIVDGQQDTGWVALTLGSGVSASTGYTPAARLTSNSVSLCGLGSGSGITTWATIPSGLRPSQPVTGATAATAGPLGYSISTAGVITCAIGGSSTFSFDGIAPFRFS